MDTRTATAGLLAMKDTAAELDQTREINSYALSSEAVSPELLTGGPLDANEAIPAGSTLGLVLGGNISTTTYRQE